MSLDDVVNLSITALSTAPSRQGFGTPLIMAVHGKPDTLLEYASPKEVSDDGFALTSPLYRLAQVLFSQNPKPAKILVGKRSLPYTQTVTLSPLKTTEGYHYTFTLVDTAGVSTAIDYTVLAGATTATIGTALAALLDPATDITAASVSGVITLTGVAGKLFNLKGLPSPSILEVADTTADPGIATDLAAVETADADTWYAVLFDHTSKLSAVAAAAWIEARRKIAFYNSTDSEILKSAVTNDLASTLKAANYARSATLFSQQELLNYSAAGWVGRMLPTDPGYATWCYKTIKGIAADKFTGTQITQLKNKNCNFYTVKGGVSVTMKGLSAFGEYLDITHGTDALYAGIQEEIFGRLAEADKVPYTDSGVDQIRNKLSAVLTRFSKPKSPGGPTFLDPARPPVITFPKVADVSLQDRAARSLPDGTFTANLAGAIHDVQITGALTV